MQKSFRKAVPDWLAILLASKLATTIVLLSMDYG